MGDLVLLRNYLDPEEAVVAGSFLQSEGIPVFLGNVHFLTVNPMLRQALGGYPLMVREEDIQTAGALLSDVEAVATAEAAAADVVCVKCGGGPVRLQRDQIWGLVGFAWGIPFARRTGKSVCAACRAVSGGGAPDSVQPAGFTLLGVALIVSALFVLYYEFIFD